MNVFVEEYERFKSLMDGALGQVSDKNFFLSLNDQSNSIAIIIKHLTGNFLSRFTDFLTTDGEKEWRHREREFQMEEQDRQTIMKNWEHAWQVMQTAVFNLQPEDMHKTVTIRGVSFTVEEALARSLAHFSYHVGQIVYLAKYFAGETWEYLTIPPGGSEAYNQNPTKEKGKIS